jgi:hypothetical protein
MRKMSFVLLAVVALSVVASPDARACGDKFLLTGRRARFQRAYCAIHPASILVYVNPKSSRAAAMRDPQFLNDLKMAGHKPQIVTEVGRLHELLAVASYDVILTELPDAGAIKQHLETSAPGAVLLPILYKPSNADLSLATQQYGTVLTAPDKMTHFLSVIDDVMRARRATTKVGTSE